MMFSDCCGVRIVDDIAGLELCPRCLEHCDVIIEEEYNSEVIIENEDMVAAREEIENMSFEEYNSLPLYKG